MVEPHNLDPTHADVRDLLGAAALGALDPEERRALDAHLATCDTCPAELARLQAAVAAYPLALDDRQPSPSLRRRIETALQRDLAGPTQTETVPRPTPLPIDRTVPSTTRVPSRSPVANPWAVAAALLLAVSLGLLAWNLQLRQDADPPETAEVVPLEAADPAVPVDGEVTYLPNRQVALLAVRDLPPLAPGQVYQAWLIRDGSPPAPAGTFDAEIADVAVAVDPDQDQTLALTIEPGPLGLPAPSGAPFALASLPS